MTAPCQFDGGDCTGECSNKGCPTVSSTGQCNPQCNLVECGYSFGDCVCSPLCSQDLYNNNQCDSICNNAACSFDNQFCGCAPGCLPNMLGNGVCDPACSGSSLCLFDYLDCSSEIYVSDTNTPPGQGTLSDPFTSLTQAIASASSGNTTVYLKGTNFYLNPSSTISDPFSSTRKVHYMKIKPWNYNGILPNITLTDQQVFFNISYIVSFENIRFSHYFNFNGTGISYCRYNKNSSDDRGQPLAPGTYLDSRFCEAYKNYDMFIVNSGGNLYLEVFYN